MNIFIDETYVFTFFRDEPSIGLHKHRDGQYSGPVSYVGEIRFSSYEQMYQFKEMIDLALEKKREADVSQTIKERIAGLETNLMMSFAFDSGSNMKIRNRVREDIEYKMGSYNPEFHIKDQIEESINEYKFNR